eukprot:TRINITY_DN6089_c0_g1_i1.p1 TRINITY_DN6089_c0_g1~~TRINITY_DN6089_c0_g1_i1.p1  ORF type:complete len:562 (-),score=97.98 TRINITY_DN6089_c0_g1_i1:409-2094(-)
MCIRDSFELKLSKEKSWVESPLLKRAQSHVFDPPAFGVTVLGCSHGFDPKGSTSGYIFWVNGRGVMLDPPPFTTSILANLGISPSLIESVIISHCHADHDAGTLQKLLASQQVEILTTPTILESFLRKYTALTGLTEPYLRSLFRFRPVRIGEPTKVHGAIFNFFYSLHTIPCVGFVVSVAGKSIYFSGDTFYESEGLAKLVEKGILTKERCNSLSKNKWNHDIILHEAGVPPIHTPMKAFLTLPEEVKSKLFLVHVAEKDIPQGSGLRSAKTGLENTITLDVGRSEDGELSATLDLLCSIPIFEDLTVKSARDLLQLLREERFTPMSIIVEEGTYGDKFYLIKSGVVRVFSYAKGKEFERSLTIGDYFGESAVIGDSMRHASCMAVTHVTLLSIRRREFHLLFGEHAGAGGSILRRLMNLKETRKSVGFKCIMKNEVFGGMNGSQKIQLETILSERRVEAGQPIWRQGDAAEFAVLVGSAVVKLSANETLNEGQVPVEGVLTMGDFIAETRAYVAKGAHQTLLEVISAGTVYYVGRDDFLHFIEANPGLSIILNDTIVID